MPTVGEFHQMFWNVSSTFVPPVHISGGGYPGWQGGVITPSLFGMIGAWIDARWALVKWHWTLAKRVHRLSKESRAVILATLDTVESPAYPHAQAAVRKTATTLGFNRPEHQRTLKHLWFGQPGPTDNIYRRLNACQLLRASAGSTFTHPEEDYLIAVAYRGFTISRK